MLKDWSVNIIVLITFSSFPVLKSPSNFRLGLDFEIPIEFFIYFFIWQLNGELFH